MVDAQALARNGAPTPNAIEAVIALGDLSKLSSEQRSAYYGRVCESLGLNPLTRPFEYLTLQGKLILYARKDCTDQLRSLRKVSLTIASREVVEGLYVVTARATLPDGRHDEEIGAVNIKGLSGDALANAMMKASTKAKRRVTLSVCGLGMLDETETETIPGATVHVEPPASALPSHVQSYAEQSFAERTGADPSLEQPVEKAKPEAPKPAGPDPDALDAEFEQLPSASQPRMVDAETPRSARFNEAVEAHKRAVAAGVKSGPPNPGFDDNAVELYVNAQNRAIRALTQKAR